MESVLEIRYSRNVRGRPAPLFKTWWKVRGRMHALRWILPFICTCTCFCSIMPAVLSRAEGRQGSKTAHEEKDLHSMT